MIHQLFPTPVCFDTFSSYDRIDELTSEFLIMDEYENDVDLFEQELPELQRFRSVFIEPAFDSYLTQLYGITAGKNVLKAWAYKNKSKTNSWDMPHHNHAGAQFSAVFYLLIEDKEGGNLLLHDPRCNANRGYHVRPELNYQFNNWVVSPKTHDYTIFPSYLFHSVTPVVNKTRIAFPVDMYME